MMAGIIYLAIIVLIIVSMWKIFVKAGKPGWASIIPIYNFIVFFEIIGKPWWWLILLFIPFVNIVFMIIMLYTFAKVFGKGVGFFFGLLFLSFIFLPILAFGDAKYSAPVAAPAA